jgi:hypothetical protein
VPINSVQQKTRYEQICNMEDENGPWDGCFKLQEEWEVTKWLLQNASQNQIDKFLKLPMVCSHEHSSKQQWQADVT